MRKLVLVAVAMVVLGSMAGSAAQRAEDSFDARVARIAAALDARPDLVAGAQAAAAELHQLPEKAVSRTDKNSFSVIGNVYFWDTDFLSDGTPLTVVAADVKRPVHQDAWVACLGALANSCRGTGRRGFDGWLLASADDEFLYLLIATKVKR